MASITITALEVHDIRFPTSEGLHGSDAMHPDPDYSAAYVVVKTSQPALSGHGLTFTIGRGNEIVKLAVEALAFLTVGRTLASITAAFGEWWKSLVNDGQLRWLGPEKGVLHMAAGALVNAVWDLWGKAEGKPVWRLLYDLTPEQLVSLIDFRWITDAVTPQEALQLFTEQRKDREERLAYLLKHGYRAYTTSAGWLGYTEAEIREKARTGAAEGWTHFKAKVGVSLEEDKTRLRIIREEIGDRTLMVDANQRWDVPQAIAYMKELAEFKPWFIEEPTCADDVLGHLAIKQALKPYNIAVATGEVACNRVMFKQFIMSGAMDICQIDSCRVAGVNEILAILLIAAKYKVPVCPHAGGVGLCEYVQHLAMFDYLCVGGKQNIIEYVNHLHEHFKYPVVIQNGCYMPPADAGYSIEMFESSIAEYTYPTGQQWQKRLSDKSSRYYQAPNAIHPSSAPVSIVPPKAAAAAAASTSSNSSSGAAGPVWLITGAQGFVGGWVIKALLDEFGSGVTIVAHDVRHDDNILSQILTPAELASVQRVYCDISKTADVAAMVAAARPRHIIHLAGLQIPTCRANPPLGAAVNVLGTVNLFNAAVQSNAAAAQSDAAIRNIVYASSAAAYGPASDYPAGAEAPEEFNHKPRTQYGVYKLANEGNARVYWQDHKLPSVGLRMMTVFGVGREVGMTSGPTKAIKSALLGRPGYEIGVKGETSFNDVRDVARLFVESAKRCTEGAIACGVRGVVASVEQFMQTAERVVPELKGRYSITPNAAPLPFPSQFEEKKLAALLGGSVPVSSLEDSIRAMADHFRQLQKEGRLSDKDLQ